MDKLCPTCSQPCEYKDGIMCRAAYVCFKKDPGKGSGDFASLFATMFGMKPGDNKGFDKVFNAFSQQPRNT